MLRVSDRAEPAEHSRWRAPRCCLPPAHQRRRSGQTAFAAQYPAYARPYRLLVCLLTETSARLGADVVRYSFIAVDSHHLLLASLPAHSHGFWCSRDGLRFHSDETRATEVAIAAQVLNRMLDLGCPNSVRVA